MKRLSLILVIFTLALTNLFAAKFTASVSKNPVSQGERFQLTFNIEGNGSNFSPPRFSPFKVLMGPSQSSSTSIINGRMSQSKSFTYVLQAPKKGTYTIKPATVKVDGKTVRSNSITIRVTDPTKAQIAKQQQEKDQTSQARKIIADNLFVRLSQSKKTVYLGEPVMVTYTLYKHPDLRLADLDLPKMPAFNGFWAQDLGAKQNWRAEVLDGVRYEAVTIQKVMLLPQQVGKLSIDPVELNAVAQLQVNGGRRSRDPFESFFGSRNYKNFDHTVRSRAGSITVKPLPDNPPASFAGGVGRLEMKAWLDKTETKSNEPVSLKIRISGSGNIKLIDPIAVELPPDIESYEPKESDNLSVSAGGFKGNKTFEYLLIPRNPGEFDIEPVEFTYFDLDKKKYVTLTSEPFTIKVTKGKGGTSSAVVEGVRKENVKYLGKDIRFIKTDASDLAKSEPSFFGSFGFIILTLLPVPLFFLLFFFRKKREEENRNQSLLRNKKATKVAKARLSAAKKHLTANDRDKFYEETSKALWGYLSDKLGIQFADLNKDVALEELHKRKVSLEKAELYMETIDECEFARYSPSGESGAMQKTYDNAASLITDMEGWLK